MLTFKKFHADPIAAHAWNYTLHVHELGFAYYAYFDILTQLESREVDFDEDALAHLSIIFLKNKQSPLPLMMIAGN